VLQLSVVHAADDPRVFERECRTLRGAGYDVTYVVPAPLPGPVAHGVKLIALPARSRTMRWTQSAPILSLVRRLRPHVVHVHDPELLTLVPALKPLAARIVYDMHEYLAQAVEAKYYIPPQARPWAARGTAAIQRSLAGLTDGVVTVLDEQFAALGERPALRIALPNYPRFARFADPRSPLGLDHMPAADGRLVLVYIGSLTRNRGIRVMLDALARLNERAGDEALLLLGGSFPNPEFEREVRARVAGELAGKVALLGPVRPDDVPGYLAAADVGWAPELPTAQYALPTVPAKMYEGMAAGLAVLASDLPGRAEMVRREMCGLVVPPGVAGHYDGLVRLLAERSAVREMGARGRAAVRARYSWEAIEGRLIDFYERLCEGLPAAHR
jgi:glycosyltransferase involved in cell wall biosynthesis